MEDRRIKYLDKVVDFLVKDTKVDYEERELFFPFTQKMATRRNTDNSTPFHKILFDKDSVIPIGGFMEYIEEIYGITYIKDVSYVWGKYKDVMRYIVFGNDPTNEPIYESEDKDKKLLDRILKYLMDDTIVNHKTGEITFPFFLQVKPPMPRKFFDFRSTSNYNFSDYCKKTYGLNDDEVIYLWPKYQELFSDEVFGRNSINESDDKKKNFLDKVVDFIVKDTITFDGEQWVRYPWDPETTLKFNSRTDLKFTYDDFRNYVIETYGLTLMDEVEYVWEELRRKLDDKLLTGDMITESDDKKQVFLNKIIDWLVRDTDVNNLWFDPPYETGLIYAENSITFSSLYKQTFHLIKYVTDVESVKFAIQKNYFNRFCKDTYGLTEDETEYVWRGYMKDLWESEKYNSLNESDDKKQVYLNKIVDWLVRDTEVGGHWFNPPYYYPGSSAGRTGFRSVYEHTFGLSTNNTYSGLDSQLIYFDHYCKNNYGLTGEETKIVWYEYMKKLKESYNWGF